MTKGVKYTKEDVLREWDEILNETEASEPNKTTKPNLLETLKTKTGLNRIRNERQGS